MINTGVNIKNIISGCNILYRYDDSTLFSNSKYLINKRRILINKYYKRKRILNGLFKWISIIFISIIIFSLVLYLIYIFRMYIGNNAIELGIITVLLIIFIDLILYDRLDSKFPTDRFELYNKYKR